jgi:CRISPR-associated endonuclease/helicase Cas3
MRATRQAAADCARSPTRSVGYGGHHGTYGNALNARTLAGPEDQEPRTGAVGGACVIATRVIVLADRLASRIGWVCARHWQRKHSPDPRD